MSVQTPRLALLQALPRPEGSSGGPFWLDLKEQTCESFPVKSRHRSSICAT